jgi:hypothetical protein
MRNSIGTIAKQFYGGASQFPLIVAANRISNPDRLQVGKRLNGLDAGTATSAFVVTPPEPPPVAVTSAVLSPAIMNLNTQRLARVNPKVAQLGLRMVDACAQAGLAILITQGLRTWEEQDALYAQGRTEHMTLTMVIFFSLWSLGYRAEFTSIRMPDAKSSLIASLSSANVPR